ACAAQGDAMTTTSARLRVGRITIVPVSDGTLGMEPGRFLSGVSPERWRQEHGYLTDDGKIPLNFGCFLVEEDGAWTLVDTGIGPRPGSLGTGRLDAELERLGVSPERIERVVLTHLHLDHIGWNTVDREGAPRPFFSNTRHIV